MNFEAHPLGRHVRHYPLHSDERRNAARMLGPRQADITPPSWTEAF